MKIVRIIGGLGNQMFQYALYMALKHKFPEEEMRVDTSLMGSYNVHNGLEIDRVFGPSLPQASFKELITLTRPVYNYKLARAIEKLLPPRKTELLDISSEHLCDKIFSPGSRYYNGYWLDYRYSQDIMEILRRDVFIFRLPLNPLTKKMQSTIRNCNNSVSIHVRRGDYLKAQNYAGLCGLDYYGMAIKYFTEILKDPTFFIFSDDTLWCKENIVPLLGSYDCHMIDFNKGTDSPLDMMLMSECEHNIIANSSFSWWGAMLNSNPDKIVCAPRKWTNNESYCRFQLPEWILL